MCSEHISEKKSSDISRFLYIRLCSAAALTVMQVKSESDVDPVLPSNVVHTSVIKMEAASLPAAAHLPVAPVPVAASLAVAAFLPVAALLPAAAIVPVIAPDVIMASAEEFVSSLTDFLKAKDFDRLVSGTQSFAQNKEVHGTTLMRLSQSRNLQCKTDVVETADSTFVSMIFTLMQANSLSVIIQQVGLIILNFIFCFLGEDFPPDLTIPVATIALKKMAAHPNQMYIQRFGCATLKHISKLPRNHRKQSWTPFPLLAATTLCNCCLYAVV